MAQGAHEVVVAPAADAVHRIGRDVRPEEDTEGRCQRPPACEQRALVLEVGVARGAVAGGEDDFAARRIARLGARNRRREAERRRQQGDGGARGVHGLTRISA